MMPIECSSSQIRTKANMQLLSLLFYIVLEVSIKALEQEKCNNYIKIKKEEEKLLFADDMIIQIENPKSYRTYLN